MTGLRVAIYARISSDRVGAGLGVKRQVEDCKALAQKNGWHVVAVLDDNDISAWSGKPRPGYDSLLGLVRDGAVDIVVCWHTDRLTRSARDLEDIIDACSLHDTTIHAVTAGPIDLSTASGQLHARIAGAVAKHESDQKAERIRRKHQELAENGAAASLHMAYGYNKDGSVNEHEAAVVRALAARLLAGESLRSLTYWLNETGVPTKKGGKTWSASTVRQILTSGRICGWREWTPRTPRTKEEKRAWDRKPRRGHGDGALVARGDWEPIISLETHTRIRALLNDPSRRSTKRRHYLLSAGILRCGRCEKTMNHKTESRRSLVAVRDENGNVVKDPETGQTVRTRADDGRPTKKYSRYACIKQSARGCGGTSIACPDLDAFVTDAIFAALAGLDLSTDQAEMTESEVAALRRRIDDAEAQLVQVGLDHTDGLITRAEWLAMRSRIESNIEALRDSLPAADERAVLLTVPSDQTSLRTEWPTYDLDRQRSIVKALIDRVIIHPSTQPVGRPKFDPSRVEIVWKA